MYKEAELDNFHDLVTKMIDSKKAQILQIIIDKESEYQTTEESVRSSKMSLQSVYSFDNANEDPENAHEEQKIEDDKPKERRLARSGVVL